MDFLNVGTQDLPEHFNTLDDNLHSEEEYENVHESLSVSIYDIYNYSDLQLNYKSRVYKNGKIQEVNNCKIIKLDHGICHEYTLKFANEGHQYISNHGLESILTFM